MEHLLYALHSLGGDTAVRMGVPCREVMGGVRRPLPSGAAQGLCPGPLPLVRRVPLARPPPPREAPPPLPTEVGTEAQRGRGIAWVMWRQSGSSLTAPHCFLPLHLCQDPLPPDLSLSSHFALFKNAHARGLPLQVWGVLGGTGGLWAPPC